MKVDDSSLYLSNTNKERTTGNSTLGKDDFLKLLVTQMQSQDPLSPMDNTQFISQMATFTSLEQTNNMVDLLTQFVNSQTTNLSDQSQVIGKTISWTETNNNTSELKTYTDVVDAVNLKGGAITYITSTGKEVDPASVFSIMNTPQDTDNGAESV